MRVHNAEQLLGHGLVHLRHLLLSLLDAGLAALDPRAAVESQLHWDGQTLQVDGREFRPGPEGRVLVLGAGKASLAIAGALEDLLGDRISEGLVAVREGQEGELKRIRVAAAEHPLPGPRSNRVAAELLELATRADTGDLVLCCFTGGSSALASLPPSGVTPEAKRDLHRMLLASGAEITEVNAVRKHVSAFKGGRVAAACAPAQVVSLTVSDVAGDVVDAITDPSVQDTTGVSDAIDVLKAYALWDHVAPSIRAHLSADHAAESPRLDPELVHDLMLVTGRRACDAMAEVARASGYTPVTISTSLSGDGRQLGSLLAQLAGESVRENEPFPAQTVLLGCGGESTVELGPDGKFGDGGPNQEAALGAALALGEDGCVSGAFMDTDGADGGTEFAGAVFDCTTRSRAAAGGIDLRSALREHRSKAALGALQDHLVTGPTGTNVNDLFAIVASSG